MEEGAAGAAGGAEGLLRVADNTLSGDRASLAEEDEDGCQDLWRLPVECSVRRRECGRCGSGINDLSCLSTGSCDWFTSTEEVVICTLETMETILIRSIQNRPQKVCLCPFLPVHPLKVSTCLYIIQHPAEESRVLRTVPLLAACLPEEKCKVLIGRRFSEDRYPELASVCRNPNTLILYPGAGAANLEEVELSSLDPCIIIIIDGTWSQAKDIFFKNSLFRIPKQVQLRTSLSSQYVIRTQPTNACLSTLECAAIALAIMEKNDYIKETILRPLQALCSFQLQHGAQIHHSKEHLLKNGLYDKPMPKNKRKLRRMELLVNNVKI